MAWPRISIVTPSFNQGAFLEETIRSVLLQGYPNLEYFVIDGGSSDQSAAIIRKYEPWLAYWVSEPDRGQSHAINKGWALASGDLIAYINSDDFFFPSAFQRVASAWGKDPAIAMLTGGVAYTDADTCVLKEKAPFLKAISPVDLSILEPSEWFLPQQSSFFDARAMDMAGRQLREELHYTMDRELMYRVCRLQKIVLLEETLAGDRQHSASKRLSQTIKMYREDALALSYCEWGGAKEISLRKRVARQRLAQGHFYFGRSAPNRVSRLVHLSLAAFYRPSYLAGPSFLKEVLRVILP